MEFKEAIEKFTYLYHIRITKKDIVDKIKNLFHDDVYVLSEELDHYHIMLFTESKRDVIKDVLRSKLCVTGNKEYSITMVRHPHKMLQYVVKEGKVHNHGLLQTTLEKYMQSSFQKKGMRKKLEALDLEYYQTDMTKEDWVKRWIHIHLDYNKTWQESHVKALIRTRYLKKYRKFVEGYVYSLDLY